MFGQPAANQTWGFGQPASARMTRAGNMEGVDSVAQTSDGINANANEWADKADAPHGNGGWLVPDPLTEKQKAVVAAYFQTHPNLDYKDPKWPNFFVQQVYKGDSIVEHNNTTEGIVAASGTSRYASGNMNLLTVGKNHQHINNFNGGTASYVNVLDKDHTVNEFATNQHSDQIMLMVNIDDTECMGYHETGSSTHHDDKAALVSWETIDTWAKSNYSGYDGCLEDGWNRSFVGFDLALKSQEEITLDRVVTLATDFPGNLPEYIYDGTNVLKIGSVAEVNPDLTAKIDDGVNSWGGDKLEKDGDNYVYTSSQSGLDLGDFTPEDWSGYDKVVIELAEKTPFNGVFAIKHQSGSTYQVNFDKGVTKIELDLTGKTVDKIYTIYFQPSGTGTMTITKFYLDGEGSQIKSYESPYLLVDGDNQIPFYSANTNQYGGDVTTLSENDMKIVVDGKTCINLPKFEELYKNGYRPYADRLSNWAKWEGGDGYFSDWIVTLTEARRQSDDNGGGNKSTKPSLHVMAEDLTAQSSNDFDFNDVVFDVDYIDANTVQVTLLAAGGTLPLQINGEADWEVHKLFDVPTTCMVNTGTKYHNASAPYTQVEDKEPVVFNITNKTWSSDQDTFAAEVNSQIVLTVQREEGGQWIELTAVQGAPTAKIATPKNISVDSWYTPAKKWAWEKQNISSKFSEWVKDPSYVWYTITEE